MSLGLLTLPLAQQGGSVLFPALNDWVGVPGADGLRLLAALLLAVLANWLTRRVLLRVIRAIAKRTRFRWDDPLVESDAFARVSQFVPALLLYWATPWISANQLRLEILDTTVGLYLIFVVLFVLDGVVNFLRSLLGSHRRLADLPIRGFSQAIKLTINIFGMIVAASLLFDKSPLVILSGLGALTAVLLLIFRDVILGLVAGIQLSLNNMVRQGDWIQIEGKANGPVIDITLTTVKVRNFDKTISNVPAYDLISTAFVNWRGMSDSGGRRIKRALRIDLRTVHFLRPEEYEALCGIQLLRPHLEAKEKEVRNWNEKHGLPPEGEGPNGRQLTNLGCFRAYVLAYLRSDDRVRKDMTYMVRQLAPDGQGVPLEVYVFTNTTVWTEYESIQSDLFDHFFAVLPAFGLALFQEPGGRDLAEALADRAPEPGRGQPQNDPEAAGAGS